MNVSLRSAFGNKAGALVLCCGAAVFGQCVFGQNLQHGVVWKQTTSAPLGTQGAAALQDAPIAHLQYYGGPIVQNPVFVNVSWGPNVASYGTQLDGFVSQVACSAEWTSTMAQYTGGSGPLTHIEPGTFWGSVVLTPASNATTLDDSVIKTQIAKWIADGKLPPNDGNTIYSVLFPPGIKITQGGTSSCVSGGFCAYHGTAAGANGKHILYAVLPDQGPGSGCNSGCGSNATLLNNVTSVLSHELAETITDPEVGLATDFAPPLAWYDAQKGEIGDICNANQGTLLGWTVQKEWSNVDNACVAQSQGFAIKAGSIGIATGQSGSSTITTQSIGGGSALPINFAVTGFPTGVTGGFGSLTASAGTSSTLFLLVDASAVPGVYSVPITGISGGIQHSTPLTLTISAGLQPQSPFSPSFAAFQVRYASNLDVGDSVIDLTNTGASSTVAAPTQNGNLCVNAYAFSPDEQLVSCCSCLVTPDALLSLSVNNDLLSNTLTPGVPTSVVVKLIATNGGSSATSCNAATVGTGTNSLATGLSAWGTTIHTLATPGTYGTAETPFVAATLSTAELARIASLCGLIESNGSGYGVCKSCRLGGRGASKQ